MSKLNEMIKQAQLNSQLKDALGKEEFEISKRKGELAANIYLTRKELNLNQKDFGRLFGVTQVMVSKWESGDYNFSLDEIEKIEKELNLVFFRSTRESEWKIDKVKMNKSKMKGDMLYAA